MIRHHRQDPMNTVADSPEYPELYALSQPQRSEPHSQVKNATLDLQQSVEGLAKSFSHILRVTHIFFCAYLAGPDKAEAAHINGVMLSNFLTALKKIS